MNKSLTKDVFYLAVQKFDYVVHLSMSLKSIYTTEKESIQFENYYVQVPLVCILLYTELIVIML